MRNEIHIPFSDVVRILKTKYHINIKRKGLRNKFQYSNRIRASNDHECIRLAQKLLLIRGEDQDTHVFSALQTKEGWSQRHGHLRNEEKTTKDMALYLVSVSIARPYQNALDYRFFTVHGR